MKLTPGALEVLKNFSTINSGILLKQGNVISTIAPTGDNILASAKVDCQFPCDFAIYDLNKFIGLVMMMGDCDLEFGLNSVVISNENNKRLTFAKASINVITPSPYIDPTVDDVAARFDLKYSALNDLIKAASLLKTEDITLIGRDDSITIKVHDKDNDSSDNYEYKIDCECNQRFAVSIPVSNLKLLNRPTYSVVIPAEPEYIVFSCDNENDSVKVTKIKYIIAMSAET